MRKDETPIMIRVMFVCHGNICRSTMAEFVFKDMLRRAGREEEFFVASAATSRDAIGSDTHHGTKRKLQQEGIPITPRRAVQLQWEDGVNYDFFIGMDRANLRNMRRILGEAAEGKLFSLLSFAGSDADIADPWYTGNFDETYDDVCAGLEGFLAYLDR